MSVYGRILADIVNNDSNNNEVNSNNPSHVVSNSNNNDVVNNENNNDVVNNSNNNLVFSIVELMNFKPYFHVRFMTEFWWL